MLMVLFIGPFLRYDSSRSSIKTSKTTLTSTEITIAAIFCLLDAFCYLFSLYISIPAANPLFMTSSKSIDQMFTEDQYVLQKLNETLESTRSSTAMLYALIEDCIDNDSTHASNSQNAKDKLMTLKFIDQGDSMALKRQMAEWRRNRVDLKNRMIELHSTTRDDRQLFDRVRFFVFTFSLLLYMHQVGLWILQYLTLQNSTWFSHTFILAIVILTQSLAFIYFLQVTNFYPLLSPLPLYIFLLGIRSFASIYYQTFHVSE